MKTQIIVSVLSFICMISVQSQENERKVQMRIIENGKVITDTTFAVSNLDKGDIDRVSKMLNDENDFVFRKGPGREITYSYHFKGFPGARLDSLIKNDFLFLKGDSLFESFSNKFHKDSAFMFDDFADRRGMHFHRMPAVIERDIISDDDPAWEIDQDNDVIIEHKGPGKNQIIIKDYSGDTKTIHKRIDKDTDVIIIKKDKKKNKPERHNSRKEER